MATRLASVPNRRAIIDRRVLSDALDALDEAGPKLRNAAPDPLADALSAIDPDAMTPREALDALYALKRLARSG